MENWLDVWIAVALATLGAVVGSLLARHGRPWWALGCGVSLGLFFIILLGTQSLTLAALPPISWAVRGRTEYHLLAFACPLFFLSCLPRLRLRRQQVVIRMFVVFIVGYSLVPFIHPALLRERHLALENSIDADGICLQSAGYTCGPAAAVTALSRLGIYAREGELAVLAGTSPFLGTPADCLCAALEEGYADAGLRCEYRAFDSVDALAASLRNHEVIAVVKHGILVDHYVTVLRVSDREVDVADPLQGKRALERDAFEKIWRFTGVALQRDGYTRRDIAGSR